MEGIQEVTTSSQTLLGEELTGTTPVEVMWYPPSITIANNLWPLLRIELTALTARVLSYHSERLETILMSIGVDRLSIYGTFTQ